MAGVNYGQQIYSGTNPTAANGYQGTGYNATLPFTFGYMGPSMGQEVGGAEAVAGQLEQLGSQQQGVQAPTINAPSGLDQTAQGQEQAGILAAQKAAAGGTPSAAGIQSSAQMGQNLAQAYAASKSGGGFGGTNAANNLMNQNAGAIAQGGQGTLAQTQAAQQIATGGMNAMAGQDVTQQGMDQNMALQQASLQQQQQQVNDSAQLSYQQMAGQTLQAQLQADTSAALAEMGDASQVGVQSIQQNAALTQQVMGASAGAASGGLSAAMKQYYNQPSSSSGGSTQPTLQTSQGGGFDPDAETGEGSANDEDDYMEGGADEGD